MPTYDRLYLEFLYYFNEARDYFECHEVMEELWLEEGRNPLYQGLLQIAVGLYHHANGNVSGSIKLFMAGVEKLEAYRPAALGIDLSKLLDDSYAYLRKLERFAEAPFAPYDLDIVVLDEGLKLLLEDVKRHPPQHEEE